MEGKLERVSKGQRERLQNAIIEAIEEFAKKENSLCLADLDFILGHDAIIMDAILKKIRFKFI